MKKIIFTVVILVSCFSIKMVNAQVTVGVGLNISSQPDWGPTGYNNASYYYMPDIDAYYDVNAHQYIYYQNNAWVHLGYLPVRYRHYDLYHGYKAVINDRDPWLRHEEYRNRYAGYRGRHERDFIRDSRDDRYRNHWRGEGNGNGYGRGHNENARDHRLDNRNRYQNQRAHNLNQRARRLNQRDRRENQQNRREKRQEGERH